MSTYTIISVVPHAGDLDTVEFGGTTPLQAAKKAFSYIARCVGLGISPYSCTFTLAKEGYQYTFSGSRTELEEPISIVRDGTLINIKYANEVHPVGDTQRLHVARQSL
jgi:hypothetical protein